ncbi:ATP-dependent DNA helicase [Rickenella mellea]|uniref:ATP-dependent DNA helicase n=1 Tax=Rickenella mellea TaxID=50990 RepID=A0A4Y7PX52_9AGAM|nr:ATP-dependent DNA helicase [Rickenella mellea]
MTAIDFTTSRAPLDNSAVSRQTIGTAQSSPTTVSRVDQTATPYYPEIIRTLKSVFKLNDFRHHQLEAINATMDGKDVFVLMPTGGGKSLCYQVPAVCHTGKTNGVTVVVSPLIALMIDQVNHLKAKKVDVVLFNSDQGLDSSREARARLLSPGRKPRLLYVTPERLHRSEDMRNILRRLYDGKELARFVVDEAHCVSTWGRDFRESYQDLDRLRVEYPKVPIMALTATANEQVMKDVIDRLRIQNCVLLKQSFNRPNLHYDVRPKQHRNVLADIAAFIKANHSGETGIIYCMSRNKCEEVARDLRDKYQLRAKHYHAQLTVEDKSRAQSAWQQGHCEIIVATIAFGMGIDKANVRFVIHHSLPKSLDGYYQETGRAGRDCEPADCVLFYTYGDTAILFKMIREGDATLEEKARQEDAIREVVRYCQNDVDCRRAQVLGYFGQAFNPRECHKSCNNCLDEAEIVEEDLTSAAKDAISLVQSLVKGGRERVTKNHCSNVFRGSMLKDVKDKGHDQQALFGAGAEMSRDRVDRLFDHLMNEQAFREEAVSNKQGWNTMYMQVSIRMPLTKCSLLIFFSVVVSACARIFERSKTAEDEI